MTNLQTQAKTAADIKTLQSAFGSVNRMDPGGVVYAGLCRTLDNASDEALVAAYRAHIKFVSPMALNRIIRRGIAI